MAKPKPTLEGPLTGVLDLRSMPDQLPPGTVRMRQNLQTVASGKLRRGTGFEKFLNVSNYNNSDFHDQLLNFSAAQRAPLTLAFEAESTRGVRSLIVGNQQVLAQLNGHNGSYRILGKGFGGIPSVDVAGPRFQAAREGDYVLFTNNYDKPQYMILEQAPDNTGNYVYPIPDLDVIGLSKAAVIWTWRNVVFLANVVMDGQRIAYRIVWSNFQGPIGFDPAQLDSIAGFKDLFTHEQILAGAPVGNSFLIYTTHGIWEMVAVGGSQSWDFRRVYNAESKDGSDTVKAVLKYPNTLCSLHDAHCYVSNDGIYFFNQYYSAPSRPEWLHQSSADLMAKIDTMACTPHVAAAFGDEIYFSIASTQATNHLPDYTLRANKTFETCDVVDHAFTCFCQFRPQDVATVRDFIVENEICTLAGLATAGYPYGNENLPRTLPTGSAAFTPDCIYQKTRLAGTVKLSDGTTDTYHVEDYTQVSSSITSLCALLAGLGINDVCKDCDDPPLFIAASATDWCLKQLGRVFYREICLNPTATGTTTSDGYVASVPSYSLLGITSIIRFPPAFGIDAMVKSEGLQLDFIAADQMVPSTVSLRVGVSGQIADPNLLEGIRWFQHSAKNLAYVTQRNQAQHDQANTQPAQTLKWRYDREARILYFELTISGTGGDATFSKIEADLRETSRTTNY